MKARDVGEEEEKREGGVGGGRREGIEGCGTKHERRRLDVRGRVMLPVEGGSLYIPKSIYKYI